MVSGPRGDAVRRGLRLARRAGGPAQDRLDPQDQLPGGEGLDHVVVGAELQADDAVHLLGLGGEHEDRDVAHRDALLQQPADLQAVHAGQHQVEDDQVRLAALRHLEGGLAVLGGLHRHAGLPQVVGDDLDDVGLVLHHEDPFAHSARPPVVKGCPSGDG